MIRSLILMLTVVAGPSVLVAQGPEYETTRIADGIYQFRFQTHNGFFVVTDDGVIAFDPISTEAARRYAEAVRRVAPTKRLLAVVYSHHHADHATGANVLREVLGPEAPIIAHENAVPKLAEAGPDLPPPTLAFDDELTLHFGERPVELHYLGNSHSDNMIVGLVPDVGVAFAVDFVSNDRVGYRDLPGYYFPDLFQAIERLLALDFETIVFGHGPPGDRASVRRQGRYYADLRAAVREAIERGWTEDEAAARVRLSEYADWGGYENWLPLNVRAMYRWLAEEEGD